MRGDWVDPRPGQTDGRLDKDEVDGDATELDGGVMFIEEGAAVGERKKSMVCMPPPWSFFPFFGPLHLW